LVMPMRSGGSPIASATPTSAWSYCSFWLHSASPAIRRHRRIPVHPPGAAAARPLPPAPFWAWPIREPDPTARPPPIRAWRRPADWL